MAAAKTKRGSKGKAASKASNRFYVVKTVQDAKTRLTQKLEDYNDKFIAQPLKTGKTFATDLKAEPRKTAAKLVDDGKARITDLNKETRTRIETLAKDGKAFLTKAGKEPRKTITSLVDDGKDLVEELRHNTQEKIEGLSIDLKIFREGVAKDTRMVIDEVIDSGNKALNRVSVKQRIEKEISSRMETIPAKFNLPSKQDVDGLVRRVKELNTKVTALSKTQVALSERIA